MKQLPSPQELMKDLAKSSLYQDWQEGHPKSYLSHFFCTITADFKAKTNWDIGFFDDNTGKITVFSLLKGSERDFEIKPADEVFKKETEKVEKLILDGIKLSIDDAVNKCRENTPKYFPNEQLGDGFLVIQSLANKLLWNFSFITKSVKFVNLKIDAEDGNVISHDVIELVQK